MTSYSTHSSDVDNEVVRSLLMLSLLDNWLVSNKHKVSTLQAVKTIFVCVGRRRDKNRAVAKKGAKSED